MVLLMTNVGPISLDVFMVSLSFLYSKLLWSRSVYVFIYLFYCTGVWNISLHPMKKIQGLEIFLTRLWKLYMYVMQSLSVIFWSCAFIPEQCKNLNSLAHYSYRISFFISVTEIFTLLDRFRYPYFPHHTFSFGYLQMRVF